MSQHFIPNNLPAGLPVCQRSDCFVSISMWMKAVGYILRNTFPQQFAKSPKRYFDPL